MRIELIGLICAIAASLIIIVIMIFALRSKSKKLNNQNNDNPSKVKIIDGVRYNHSKVVNNNDVSYNHGDTILKRGISYAAKADGTLLPGKYIVLAASQNKSFNLRISGFVREYSHGDAIVLCDGDTITAVSDSVILR